MTQPTKAQPQTTILSKLGLKTTEPNVKSGVYTKPFQTEMELIARQNGFTFVPVAVGDTKFSTNVSNPAQQQTEAGSIVLPAEKTYTRVATDAYVTYIFRLADGPSEKNFLKSTLDVFQKRSTMEEVSVALPPEPEPETQEQETTTNAENEHSVTTQSSSGQAEVSGNQDESTGGGSNESF